MSITNVLKYSLLLQILVICPFGFNVDFEFLGIVYTTAKNGRIKV